MDYKTLVLEDGCADADPEIHEFLMENIFPRSGSVTHCAEFLHALA